MPIFKLIFSEEQTQVRCIEIEAEGATREDATQAALKAYQNGEYDTQLEETTSDHSEYRNEIACYNHRDEYVVLLPWD